jgi:ubiquitin C-terminal hydrolase
MFVSIYVSPWFRYEQRDSHEFLSDLVDFLHDELAASSTQPDAAAAVAASSGSTIGGRVWSPKENENPNVAEGKLVGELENGTVGDQHCASTSIVQNDRSVLLPTDKYFQLNVRVCLECDSCGYSR